MSACLISAVKAFQMIKSSCEAYLVHVVNSGTINNTIENTSIVNEFPNVFLADIPGLPLDKEVKFIIELVPGVAPISISLYRMAPIKLKELKTQLQELLNKGFIRPSVTPWGASVFFMKKKKGNEIVYRY